MPVSQTSGELKQRILRRYNATNQAVWGAGVREQRVELLGADRVRVPHHGQRVDPPRRGFAQDTTSSPTMTNPSPCSATSIRRVSCSLPASVT
jgi:hypothetical protein